MSEVSDLTHADALITATWARSIADLEDLVRRRVVHLPVLKAVLHIRSALVVTDGDITALRHRLHALTRPDHVPHFLDHQRLAPTATDLARAHAESQARLQAIRALVDAYPEGHLADELNVLLSRRQDHDHAPTDDQLRGAPAPRSVTAPPARAARR
ncbi:hypothetical protein ACIBUY_04180 [Streptomyces sp. NPDC050085]|uniref:hypothetical protein n=1 Tax=Streptomyces sp. NPDC050085 TaxID=3365600 RepID=UPI0037934B4D